MNTTIGARIISKLIRHALTAVGGMGMMSDGDIEKLASLAAMLIGLLWSLWEARHPIPGNAGTPSGSGSTIGGGVPGSSLPPGAGNAGLGGVSSGSAVGAGVSGSTLPPGAGNAGRVK